MSGRNNCKILCCTSFENCLASAESRYCVQRYQTWKPCGWVRDWPLEACWFWFCQIAQNCRYGDLSQRQDFYQVRNAWVHGSRGDQLEGIQQHWNESWSVFVSSETARVLSWVRHLVVGRDALRNDWRIQPIYSCYNQNNVWQHCDAKHQLAKEHISKCQSASSEDFHCRPKWKSDNRTNQKR